MLCGIGVHGQLMRCLVVPLGPYIRLEVGFLKFTKDILLYEHQAKELSLNQGFSVPLNRFSSLAVPLNIVRVQVNRNLFLLLSCSISRGALLTFILIL